MSSAFDVGAWLHAFVRDPAFLERYPYYAAILARLHAVADPSVQRMAVSLFEGRFFLHVNVDSFVAEPHYLRGVLLHEVHHIALGHLGHPKFSDVDHPELMDLALEMSANEYIQEPLPDPIVCSAYEAFGVRAGQSTLERYHCLAEAQRVGAEVSPQQASARGDQSRRVDDHRLQRRGERSEGIVEHTRQLLQRAIDDVRQAGPEPDDPRRKLLAGRDPGRLIEELCGVLGPAEVFLDWKTALRMFVARARAPVHTWSRPNRRFPNRIGAVPGRTYSPRAIQSPTLLVAVDTSMSMTTFELEEVARQLAELANFARITVVECDAEITNSYPFTGALRHVAGRGGTDLRPVFTREFLASHKADGVIYFSDGDGPFPEQPPPLPVLWVLTKPLDFDCPWGSRALLVRSSQGRTSVSRARPSAEASSRDPRSPRLGSSR